MISRISGPEYGNKTSTASSLHYRDQNLMNKQLGVTFATRDGLLTNREMQ